MDMAFQLTTYAPAEYAVPAPGAPKTDTPEKR
jgi:hypothetical protein